MPRSPRNHNRRWDVPAVIRVEDKDNALKSAAALGRAVGWAQIQVRALNRFLRGPQNNKRLPHRVYHYSMPVSNVKRISIWTNPPDGMWFVRIIGGSSFIGSILWQPQDNLRPTNRFGNFRSALQINTAEGFGGAYSVREHGPCEAKLFDWKGKLQTTRPDGTPIPNPRRDVITFDGNPGRHFTRGGGRSPSEFVYKEGVKYARMPDIDINGNINYAGFADPETGRLGAVPNYVAGFAIQADPDTGERRDVLIMNSAKIGGVAGVREWRVFWRPADTGLTTNGVVRFIGDEATNKWRLIRTFSLPSDFEPVTYGRKDSWFFNESGTEATMLLAVHQVGDWAGDPSAIPIPALPGVGSIPSRNFLAVNLDVFPYYHREVTISIDAFANTVPFGSGTDDLGEATLDVGGRVGGPMTATQNTSGSATFGGAHVAMCEDDGPFMGTLTESGASNLDTPIGGETQWLVAVDYQGDNKVRAFLNFEGGDRSNSFSYSLSDTAGQPNTGNVSQGASLSGTFRLTAPGIDLVTGGYQFNDSTSVTGNQSGSAGGERNRSFTSNGGPLTAFMASGLPTPHSDNIHIDWLDLREGLIAYNYTGEIDWNSVTPIDNWLSGSGNAFQNGPLAGRPSHVIAPGGASGTAGANNGFRIVKNGGVLVERRYASSMSIPGSIFSFSGISNGLQLESDAGCAAKEPGSTRTISYFGSPPVTPDGSLVFTPWGGWGIDSINKDGFIGAAGLQGLAVDTAGNVATTWTSAGWLDSFSSFTFGAAGSNGTWRPRTHPIPDEDRYVNFLTGLTEDQLLDLVNSIPHHDPGPNGRWDGIPPAGDDIEIIGLQADEDWRLFIHGVL